LAAGVSRREIERSLRRLPARWSGGERPLEQLDLLARDRRVLVRDAHGYLTPASGQRLFDFDPQEPHNSSADNPEAEHQPSVPFLRAARDERWSARDWFVEGCRQCADGEIEQAVESFRLSLMTEPSNPEVHFYLAECLYRRREVRAALERSYVAAELDHEYLEAWTQIGCLHRELGEPESALDAFGIALAIHADYAEAHYHKAEVLHELGRSAEAIAHWETYLAHDSRGPWADIARQRLESEMS
jgi:tetratricopeptide (TPR) repeat protein